jgi:hypothetical protein
MTCQATVLLIDRSFAREKKNIKLMTWQAANVGDYDWSKHI